MNYRNEWDELVEDDRSNVKKIMLWVLAPFYSPLLATLICFLQMSNSFVFEAISDFIYRWPKWFNVFFWGAYYPTAGYYQWENSKGEIGPYKWLWRLPKHPKWRYAGNWWVFRI